MAKHSKMTNYATGQQANRKKRKPAKTYNIHNIIKSEVKDGMRITQYSTDDAQTFKKEAKQRYPGRRLVDPKLLEKYSKGQGIQANQIGRKDSLVQHKLNRREWKIQQAEEDAARAETLLTESSGLMEAEEGTYTSHISQTAIRNAVDITSAAKSFDLKLEFGPYKMQFTRNGRYLVLGGRKGHLAAIDWITKKLHFEINVMESIHDVCWLHTEQMMATAQKKWVYIYDNQGIELHCLKRMDRILKLEFLPYHFLLCAGSESGFLSWLDVSLGKEIIQFPTRMGRLEIMCQNPYNAVLCCGHSNGTVSMWTPNDKKPVASVLCHTQPVKAIAIDPSGRYMATAGADKMLKIWDARNLGGALQSYLLGSGASNITFSQRNLLSVAMGNVVEVFKNILSGGTNEAYIRHRSDGSVTDMQFCPYEDILGISTYKGYSSLIIPGAGEPNFDGLEANPYISVAGRKEAEIKSLLAKVPSTLITLDPLTIGQVDVPRLQEKVDAKRALIHIRPPQIDFTPRYRMKGKSGSAQKFKRRQKVQEGGKREYLKAALAQQEEFGLSRNQRTWREADNKPTQILDRFKPKNKNAPKPKF